MTGPERIAELEAKLAEEREAGRNRGRSIHRLLTRINMLAVRAEAAEAKLARGALRALDAACHCEHVPEGCCTACVGEIVAAAESREKALREALTHSVNWFWGPESEDLAATHDRVAAEFYAETGFIAPGKDVPAAMNAPWTEEQRRAAWNAWVTRKREALEIECLAALAAGEGRT